MLSTYVYQIIQDAKRDALEEDEKKVYTRLLKLANTKDQINGLLDFGWDHEMILDALMEKYSEMLKGK